MRLPRALASERGFTLIETLVASIILAVGVAASVAVLDRANDTTQTNRAREAGTNLARDLVEAARGVPYERLTSAALLEELRQRPGLEASPGAGPYAIERRGTVFTVGGEVCVVDDPRDGLGAHQGGDAYCADSSATGGTDRNPEDYKRVRVTVTWQTRGLTTRSISQTGVVNNPGSAAGPAVRTLALAGGAISPVTSDAVSSLSFAATTSSRPAAVNWLLDGVVQQPAPSASDQTGLGWQFAWSLAGVDDGPYLVSAEAFDEHGVSGATRSFTVQLNRYLPRRPEQAAGGRTVFGTVEIEWAGNTERDIVGYQVFRDGQVEPVCALRITTECADLAPPDLDALVYRVVAYDRDPAGALRASAPSEDVVVVKGNTPPNPVTELQATTDGHGVVTLQWRRPSPADSDPDDGVDYYRIYRDGKALANRFDRWFSPEDVVTWQDSATGGQPHTYYVTAVDRRYAESEFVGPVTGG